MHRSAGEMFLSTPIPLSPEAAEGPGGLISWRVLQSSHTSIDVMKGVPYNWSWFSFTPEQDV